MREVKAEGKAGAPRAQGSRMSERRGPCGNLECSDMDNSSGQWTFIPVSFTGAIREGATCSCKKAACRRYFKLGTTGVKRPQGNELSGVVWGEQLPQGEVPIPYSIQSIKEIWGVRQLPEHKCQASFWQACPPSPSAIPCTYQLSLCLWQACERQRHGPSGAREFP